MILERAYWKSIKKNICYIICNKMDFSDSKCTKVDKI